MDFYLQFQVEALWAQHEELLEELKAEGAAFSEELAAVEDAANQVAMEKSQEFVRAAGESTAGETWEDMGRTEQSASSAFGALLKSRTFARPTGLAQTELLPPAGTPRPCGYHAPLRVPRAPAAMVLEI